MGKLISPHTNKFQVHPAHGVLRRLPLLIANLLRQLNESRVIDIAGKWQLVGLGSRANYRERILFAAEV